MRKRQTVQKNASNRAFWKWIASLAISVHLLAVFAEPFRFFTRSARGTSPAADPPRNLLAPYIEFFYLNHGYFFFAPEPGPSHLMAYQLQMEDGSLATLTYPDRDKQWPRLLYHRHFMLAEFLQQLHVPPYRAEFAGPDPQLARQWQADRAMYERIRQSMTDHVVQKYAATSATVDRLEHRLPSDDEVFRQKIKLNSPLLYIALPDSPLDFEPGVGASEAATVEPVRPSGFPLESPSSEVLP